MKHFFLIVNGEKPQAEETAVGISSYLESRGGVCVCQKQADMMASPEYHYTNAARVPKDTECVITLGGDGTLIQAARDLADLGLPMVGVNLGHLGYLAQISREEKLEPVLDELLADRYQLEQRMMLEGTVYHNGEPCYRDIAFNDIVITRKDALRVLKFQIYVNGRLLNEYAADGVILSTPTGSTAYNLSAGGPIVAPDAQVMVVTPICPHTLVSRSIVLPAKDLVQVKVVGDDVTVRTAVFDGDTLASLTADDWIEIGRSKVQTTLIKLKDISFLDNLRNKMNGI